MNEISLRCYSTKTVQVPVKWDPLGNFPHLMIGKSLYLADDRVIKEV